MSAPLSGWVRRSIRRHTMVVGCIWAGICRHRAAPLPALPCLPLLPRLNRDRARAPTVLLLSAEEPAALRHALPALGDLPTAGVPLGGAGTASLPPLGWQLPAARAAVAQLQTAGEWLQVRGCCRGS